MSEASRERELSTERVLQIKGQVTFADVFLAEKGEYLDKREMRLCKL